MTGTEPALLTDREAESLGLDGVAFARDAQARLAAGLQALPDKPEETTVSTFRALWLLAAGRRSSAVGALTAELPPLDPPQRARMRELVATRLGGVPLAHLTGRQRFMGLEMVSGPGALIPRRETEILARAGADVARQVADETGHVLVVDACTGSGNLAAALAVAESRAAILASDLSPEAVALARRNVEHLGLRGRVDVRQGDLFAPFDTPDLVGRINLVVCNPPYISHDHVADMPSEIARHEPSLAFDGGPLGLDILLRLVREAPRMLRPGGWLGFEVGLGQGDWIARRAERSGGYARMEVLRDAGGQVRAILARTIA